MKGEENKEIIGTVQKKIKPVIRNIYQNNGCSV